MCTPAFYYDEGEQHCIGGLFHDGRAKMLQVQAIQPLLIALEMANPNKESVVTKVRAASYALLFDQVFGDDSRNNDDTAMAAFERTELSGHSPQSMITTWQARRTIGVGIEGVELFEAEDKCSCAGCRSGSWRDNGEPPLFTDFIYDNIGPPIRQTCSIHGLDNLTRKVISTSISVFPKRRVARKAWLNSRLLR